MNWKLIIVLVVGGMIIGQAWLRDGPITAIMLFGLMLAGVGLGRMLIDRRK